MTEQQYQVYVETVEEQSRRHAATTWLMGWLDGHTYTGVAVDDVALEHAKQLAEEKFGVKLLGSFGPSESPREET